MNTTNTTTRRQFQLGLLALPWALSLPAAHAHGDQHGKAASTVVKEQKPWASRANPAPPRARSTSA